MGFQMESYIKYFPLLSGKYAPTIWNEFPFVENCNQLREIFLKKFYFPLEVIQKALKTSRKTDMTNWKVRKETVIDLFSFRVKKHWAERRGGERGGIKKRKERK